MPKDIQDPKTVTNLLTGVTYTPDDLTKAFALCRKGISTKEGLLYAGGELIDLPMADLVAMVRGEQCAERLVTRLEGEQNGHR